MDQYNASEMLRPLPYREKDLVQRTIQNTLLSVPSLRPRVEDLVANNGTVSRMMCLTGTIPISYRGAHYNIPVKIWLGHNFPNAAPICYVTPTSDMRIKSNHKHVDTQGLVYLRYLHEWKRENSELVQLITMMASEFGHNPPVFKKPANDYGGVKQQQPVYKMPNSQQPPAFQQPNYQQPNYQQPKEPSPRRKPEKTPEQIAADEKRARQLKEETEATERIIRESELREKARTKVQEVVTARNTTVTNEINSLFDASRQMKENESKIINDVEAMEKEKMRLRNYITELDKKNVQIKEWLKQNAEQKDDVDPNEIVKPADTWSQQLFDLVASDLAADDVLNELDKALGNGTIKIKPFFNTVQPVAKQQFLDRALIKKIVERQNVSQQAAPGVPHAHAQSSPVHAGHMGQPQLPPYGAR